MSPVDTQAVSVFTCHAHAQQEQSDPNQHTSDLAWAVLTLVTAAGSCEGSPPFTACPPGRFLGGSKLPPLHALWHAPHVAELLTGGTCAGHPLASVQSLCREPGRHGHHSRLRLPEPLCAHERQPCGLQPQVWPPNSDGVYSWFSHTLTFSTGIVHVSAAPDSTQHFAVH